MIALAFKYWWAIVIAGLLAALGVQSMRLSNAHEEYAQYKLNQGNLAREAERAAREKEQSWQEEATKTQEAHDEQIRIIGDQLDTALASLSKRPNRPAGNLPKASSACHGATGAELSRPDAEFLTRLAGRADKLRSALEACQAQYETLRH